MSDNSQATGHEEDHTGPIKTPKQLLLAAFFSFVIPIFVIIGLVYYVTSANKPAAGAVNVEKATAEPYPKNRHGRNPRCEPRNEDRRRSL